MAIASANGWTAGMLDISTAFLNAELEDAVDGVIVVRPPQILVDYGLVAPGVLWKLGKVLYGLRAGPKKWTEHRDAKLDGQEVKNQ